jgi:hypothetical protein
LGADDRPERGVRFRLDRERDDGATAHYGVVIATPEQEWTGAAVLTDAGAVTLAIDAPAELVAAAEMFAKLTARGAAQRRTDGLVAWPARVLRWREPKSSDR